MALQLYLIALLAILATVIDARDSKEGEFPFQVSIRNLNNEHLCGGAIITSKWVLTSADCAKGSQRLEVSYGIINSETVQEPILSERIEIQKDISSVTNVLALIELEKVIPFSSKVKPVKLPRRNVNLVNGTISGWKANAILLHQWTLQAIDPSNFTYVTRDCKNQRGQIVSLGIDQFCLHLDPSEYTSLASLGATLSRGRVLLGFQPQKKLTPLSPIIFVEISHHGQWIKDTLQEDSEEIQWADSVPSSTNKLKSSYINLAFGGVLYFFLILNIVR